MTPWNCSQCGEEQIAFGRIPEDGLCYSCHEAWHAASAFPEAGAGIPKLFRDLTRQSWSACFQLSWPADLESTSQLLSELLRNPTAATPPPLLSRWLSSLHVRIRGTDVRLRRALR